jgi:hypothetical protein
LITEKNTFSLRTSIYKFFNIQTEKKLQW